MDNLDYVNMDQKDSQLIFKPRLVRLNSGDVLYCNVEWIKDLGYDRELKLGEIIYINTNADLGIYCVKNEVNVKAFVTRIIKNIIKQKKKWWQFWKKPKEEIKGYHLMII